MHIEQPSSTCKPERDRGARYAGRLGTLRFQTIILRCQLAKADNEDARELLARRLDLTDARSAEIHARLHRWRAREAQAS